MKLFKSKSGFTLIELLVVIGILAVLAAIAIPSVAGLIDRANVSADKTNANEMTNAIERFAAEYELYCQDIASGVITASTADFDAAQGRVYNVTRITDRDGITAFESETGFNGKGINRDTKYPVNEATLKSIVENYTKTSSATFTPKQSDHEFYYSPEVGIVITGETGATIDALNDIAFASEDDIAQFNIITWICLDDEVDNIATDTQGVFGELENSPVVPVIKTMTIDGVAYQFEDGMTWGAWLESKYNTPNSKVWCPDIEGSTWIRLGDGDDNDPKLVIWGAFVTTPITSVNEINASNAQLCETYEARPNQKILPLNYRAISIGSYPFYIDWTDVQGMAMVYGFVVVTETWEVVYF